MCRWNFSRNTIWVMFFSQSGLLGCANRSSESGSNHLGGKNRVICEVALSSPSLWACLHPLSLFQWYPQSNEILLNLSMKCWNSALNAQGLRVIIVVVQGRSSENICQVEQPTSDHLRYGSSPFLHKVGFFLTVFAELCISKMICRARRSYKIWNHSKWRRIQKDLPKCHQNWWKNYFGSQSFCFVKFSSLVIHSHLCVWCPIMSKLAILAP
jgi:hypothetical protein